MNEYFDYCLERFDSLQGRAKREAQELRAVQEQIRALRRELAAKTGEEKLEKALAAYRRPDFI
ncbi:hypothetical protein MUN46_008165 [Mesosutterella sp. AGMB02718]|uniref:Uncharacterized protein n=1 Tax=Mesosutterella faecium TaxID=2925194 RepID=A0ABT7INE3_9BURK|nr:hypothetical protein [Mesosutterella sp. AGMB02718]MDL2059902.1 hypothetical protein [Mesosutterella sp. AGMB02718]